MYGLAFFKLLISKQFYVFIFLLELLQNAFLYIIQKSKN